VPVPGYFCYYSSVVLFGVQYYDTSSIALFAEDYFRNLGSFHFHMNFMIDVFVSNEKNGIGILMGIALNL
jgi:hypothetical protein